MIRRRSIAALAATAALVTAGTVGASSATADTGTTELRASEDYIACVGLRIIPIATCIEEPLGPLFDALLP